MQSDLTDQRLDVIVENALKAVSSTVGAPLESVVDMLSKNLKSSGGTTVANNNKVSFTMLAVYVFAAVIYQMTKHAEVRCAFKGNSPHLSTVELYAETFFRKYSRFDSEYLVDFYANATDRLLCPLVTMESESTKESSSLEFHDFKKLLSVSSPRRIYLFHCESHSLSSSIEKLSSLTDQAYQSQTVLRGDEIVVVAHIAGATNRFESYPFDVGRRMGLPAFLDAPAIGS